MSKETEEWKDIPGFEGLYQVSDLGRVKSLDRGVEAWNAKSKKNIVYRYKGKILTQTKDKDGYMMLALGKHHPNKKVHRLVAEAFIPNPENKSEIDHIDGNPENNIVENLRWANRKENINNPITKERMVQNALKQYKKRVRNKLGQFK